jgi:uncharacterized protein (TIGR02117 family)
MARLLRNSAIALLAVLAGSLLAMGLGILVPRPFQFPDMAAAGQGNPADTRRILILSNPIHTDIALPADRDVLEAFGFVSESGLALDHPGVFWIVFGWGGRSFYLETPTWADLKPGPVINALTWDASVMHVRRTGDIPQSFEAVRTLDLRKADFDALVSGIRLSFSAVPGEQPVPIPSAAYDNTWTARMLRTAGVRTGTWTPLPMTLTWSLALHNSR